MKRKDKDVEALWAEVKRLTLEVGRLQQQYDKRTAYYDGRRHRPGDKGAGMKIDEAVSKLIEKLRSVKWEVIDDDDWDSRCVFVDMRPDDFRDLLREAASALEAAQTERDTMCEALRAERDALRKAVDTMNACGWQEGEDPSTEGLYVARDSKGNVEVGMWYAKTAIKPAEWTREFRDVDRDDIVAWMGIPDW